MEKNENDIEGYVNENRLLHQATQKLEKQLANLQSQNESLQRTLHQTEYAHQAKVNTNTIRYFSNEFSFSFLMKINECESLLISLKDANKESIGFVEQKKAELNFAQTQIQTLKYEQSVIIAKVCLFF